MSLTEISVEIMKQQQYLLDEITETLTALGGKHGKAAWKAWKADHEKVAEMKLNDLTTTEKDELTGECADVMIFALNIMALCGMEWGSLIEAVESKQRENISRWESGY